MSFTTVGVKTVKYCKGIIAKHSVYQIHLLTYTCITKKHAEILVTVLLFFHDYNYYSINYKTYGITLLACVTRYKLMYKCKYTYFI